MHASTQLGGDDVTHTDSDPLGLRDQAVVRFTVPLPLDTAIALYHYCLRSGADEAKLPVAAARIVTAFLDRDEAFKRWRDEHGETLPAALPRRRIRPARAGARRA
jgi:hypothetical protein